MVEELKLAIKIDDATIEQSLLKQFANAQKMADKVVLDFKSVNFDDKQIEAKFKEMQKKAGQNPIDLTIGGNTLDMLGQIDKRLTEIFSIGKGKSFIDSSSTVADIGKIVQNTNNQAKAIDKVTNSYKNQAYELASVLKMLAKLDQCGDVPYAEAFSKAVKSGAKSYKNGDDIQFAAKKYGMDEDSIKYLRGLSVNLSNAFNYTDTLGLDTANISNVEKLIEYFRELLKEKLEFNNTKLNTSDIEELIKALGIAKKELFDDGTKSGRNIYGDGTLDKYSDLPTIIQYLKQQETQAIATAKAENKLAETQKTTSFTNNITSSDLQKNLVQLYKDINQVFKDNDGKQISGYWNTLKQNIENSNIELKELLKNLGLIDLNTNQLKLINNGMENFGGIIGEDKVLIARKNNRNQFDEKNALKIKLQEAYDAGINVARILDIIGTKESNVFFDIQEKADGNILGNIYGQNEKDIVNTDWLYATDEQVQKLITDMIELQKMGINVESNLTNIIYDKAKGFSFIDMDLNPTNFENNAELIKDHIMRIFGDLEDFYADKNDKINQKLVKNARQRFENISKQVQQVYSDSNKTSIPLGDSITTSTIDTQNKLQEELKETQSQAKKAKQAVKEVSSTASQDQIKDTFSDSPTNTKPETEGMEQVEKATEEAVREKKDFATANEGVQSSIDGSENPLKLEAELMEQIAKSAREAADAKKEFVEANKQVKDSADESNSDLKAKPKKDRYAKRRKVSEEDFLNYSPNRVNKKLSNSGYTILGETVNTELVDGLVKVSAKIKDVDGVWKSFSAKVDADGNIFEQRFKTVTNGVDKLETALKNFGHETSPALTYQETLDKAQKIKNSLNLGDEYSIKVDSSEFVTITKKLIDVENAGSSVTQTFKSAQDAIDNFGKATSNSAEKTSVALKSIKSNVKEVVDETEKLANAQKEQNTNVNFNGYDKRLDSYNGKVDKYQATIDRFNDGGWTSDTY